MAIIDDAATALPAKTPGLAQREIKVLPPLSKAGDWIVLAAEMDLIIGLTACSALQSNNGSFKPIHYRIDEGPVPLAAFNSSE